MKFIAAVAAGIAGKLGERKTPKETESPEFNKRQAIREYNALLDRTDPTEPGGTASMKCLSSDKGRRRNQRHDLIRKVQNNAAAENNTLVKKRMLAIADRLAKDMDRVEDARLSLHAYTANEEGRQEEFLKPMRDQAPPGFKMAALDQAAEDFGVDKRELEYFLRNNDCPSQKIMVYERDPEILGPGPKYTVAFRGSTRDVRDWNNNGRNEAGFEAPHQKNAASLGVFLENGTAKMGKSIDSLVNVTGHSKGGSEAQAFAAATGCAARVFNTAGFNPQQYEETFGASLEKMRIDRTTVIDRGLDGRVLPSSKYDVHTDPLFYAQHEGLSRYIMLKPVTSGPPRELAPIDPNLSVPCKELSNSEAHSMLQVIEAMERDKKADQDALTSYR